MKSNNILAISFFVYQLDGFDEIRGKLENFIFDSVICFTCNDKVIEEFLKSEFSDFENIIVKLLEPEANNVTGMVYSYFETCDLSNYFLHIHNEGYDKDLLDFMHSSVICNPKFAESVLKEFDASPELDCVFPLYLFKSIGAKNFIPNNTLEILPEYGDEGTFSERGYVEGNMLWLRVSSFHKYFVWARNIVESNVEHYSDILIATMLDDVSNSKDKYRCTMMPVDEELHDIDVQNTFLFRENANSTLKRLKKILTTDLTKINLECFDLDAYEKRYPKLAVNNLITHYLYYGEFENIPAFDGFYPAQYYFLNQDVIEAGFSALLHYLLYGKKECRPANIDDEELMLVAERWGLFDSVWYERNYNDVIESGLEPKDHYLKVGQYLERATSEVIAEEINTKKKVFSLIPYLRDYAIWEVLYRRELLNSYNGQQNAKLLFRIRSLKDWILFSQFYNVAHAVAENEIHNFDVSEKLFLHYYNVAKKVYSLHDGFPKVRQSNKANDRHKSLGFEISKPKEIKSKVCIYTALFGDFDELKSPLNVSENIDYICFSDKERTVSGWKTIVVDPKQANHNLNAKIFKILPHSYLKDYDYSLFVDANTLFTGNVERFIGSYLMDKSFVMWKHPDRSCIYDESRAIVQGLRHEPVKIINQLKKYAAKGLPKQTGLAEASFIWRKHSDASIVSFMEEWWEEIIANSQRDQLSLGYLMWKRDFYPMFLPHEMGNSRTNSVFTKLPHIKNHFHKDAPTGINDENKSELNNNSFVINGLKKNIAFIYSFKHRNAGSTIMRGEQLSNIIRDNCSNKYNVTYSPSAYFINSILFLTKGYLKEVSIEELKKLKEKGNILLFDFVDDKVRLDILEYADVLIAASITSYLYYCKNFKIEVRMLTHHVDPRISKLQFKPINNIKMAYFGEIPNTFNSELIRNKVDMHSVNTRTSDDRWLENISNYNCHYALRNNRAIDGGKPFLKGFTAASLQSNILIQRSEKEALYYLTDNYPFLYDGSLDEHSINTYLEEVKDSYGSKDWLYGLEIMQDVRHRSSDSSIVSEFESIIDDFYK